MTYVEEYPEEEYIPTIFENHDCNITVDGKAHAVQLWDTAGQEDFERIRKLNYPGSDAIILCFSVNERTSYTNVESKWIPELERNIPGVPIVLVATKVDLRNDSETIRTLGRKIVTKDEGQILKRNINAFEYIECSALARSNVDIVFETATKAAAAPLKIQRPCSII